MAALPRVALLLHSLALSSASPALSAHSQPPPSIVVDKVERWNQFEIELKGPSNGNPFLDVELHAAFTLQKPQQTHPMSTQNRPEPLVALDFARATGGPNGTVPNMGSSAGTHPSARLLSVSKSLSTPAGSAGRSADFSTDSSIRHVVELPGDKRPFTGGLAGLRAFTIAGWVYVRDGSEGPGGDRLLNFCDGSSGVDLVWVSQGGGHLKLSINEWPDGAHPASGDATMPASPQSWPRWRFFAVSYDADAQGWSVAAGENNESNVKWYFGDSLNSARRDAGASGGVYSRGAVADPLLPLAFGNFGSGFHADDRLLRGGLFNPQVFSRALALEEIVAVQNRSGCKPDCRNATCGSDGCGGSCGTCTGAKRCGTDGGVSRTCEMPTTVEVGGFYDGAGTYRVRFAPPFVGRWVYTTHSNVAVLDGQTGGFDAVAASAGNHGPVRSVHHRLEYADGTPYFSVGSTSYQWTSKDFDMQEQTLRTLAHGQGDGPIFNKQRMTVFPKWYAFNHANPVETGTAYEIIPGSVAANLSAWGCVGANCPSTSGSFDLTRFNVSYFQNYERLLRRMQALGVIADIIVFHPYDEGHWGFDCMGGREGKSYNTTNDEFYLRYLAARLASFSNVWWAMANEWSFCACKSYGAKGDDGPTPVWDRLFEALAAADPYGRQTSIHNGNWLYNHSRPWITHVSLQGHEEDTPQLRAKYGKPTVWDEVRYEGNISSSWGALSGEEEADRFWWGASLGVYVGHSETVLHAGIVDDDAQPLWWAKGGTLVGSSPARIRWFRKLWEANASRPAFGTLSPSVEYFDDGSKSAVVANMLSAVDGRFFALHFLRSGRWTVPLPAGSAQAAGGWEVRSLDYWAMRLTVVARLPHNATGASLSVPATPANFEIVHVA